MFIAQKINIFPSLFAISLSFSSLLHPQAISFHFSHFKWKIDKRENIFIAFLSVLKLKIAKKKLI